MAAVPQIVLRSRPTGRRPRSCRHSLLSYRVPRFVVTLSTPGGGAIHINVEQVTSVRSDTQIPGAKAQLDLASGKLQGVVENVERVMQLIVVAASAVANDQCS